MHCIAFFIVLQHSSSEQLDVLLGEYDKMQLLIGRLRDLQNQPEAGAVTNREDCLPSFEKWVQSHGVNYQDNVRAIKVKLKIIILLENRLR